MRYVAIDLETTGLDPGSAEIMELAAIKFGADGQIEAKFVQLLDPGQQIPLRLSNLTGITEQMVAGKPTIAAVLPDFLVFTEGLPLVAHNADFEEAFLTAAARRAGLPLNNHFYDTVELARLVLPLAKNHRLATLASALELPLTHAHRAEDDAIACGLLFSELVKGLQALDPRLLEHLLQLGAELSNWGLRPLVEAARDAAVKDALNRNLGRHWLKGARPLVELEPPPERPVAFDPAQAAELLGPEGPVAAAFGSYEHRPGQLQASLAVGEALTRGQHLLLEAGTGTGKSLAYLVPAVLWAKAKGEKVVVTTHTITLQEQLIQKDIPFLQAALSELPFRAALVKGRQNYICLRKYEEGAAAASFSGTAEERLFYMRLSAWLAQTETGDRAELNLWGQDDLWEQVQSETETCLGTRCRWHRQCFALGARRAAREADLLVANHSLVLADLATGNQVLPPYHYLIVDEAHHLEAVATQHLGLSISERDLRRTYGRLFRGYREGGSPGLLGNLRRQLPAAEGFDGPLERLISQVGEAREATGELFALLTRIADAGNGDGETGGRTLRLTEAHRQSPFWQPVLTALENAVGRLSALSGGLAGFCERLEAEKPLPAEQLDGLLLDLAREGAALAQAAERLTQILLRSSKGLVYWFELYRRGDYTNLTLKAAHINLGPILKSELFDPLRSVVLSSATLAIGGDFGYLRRRLGLDQEGPERLATLTVPSPFEYRQQALLTVPTDLPSPRGGDALFTPAVTDFLADYLLTVGGQTLVLFTSHRMLRAVADGLRERLADAGVLLLAQGLDGHRSRLVEEFKETPRAVLFGSASYWEGVDIPGEGLRSVVMVKLPFQVPTEPVIQARTEDLEAQGKSAFNLLALPEAIIRFKQGFGRLIRTRDDRGVVVVLDGRVAPGGSGYGQRFLKALPGPTLYGGPTAEVIRRAATWLEGND